MEPLVGGIVGEWSWDVPLRVLAGLHLLVLTGRAEWDDVAGALRDHGDLLRRFVAEQPVQTNEVQRSWLLLPCFLEVTRRTGAEALDLIELGPSAGLNLVWDRYRHLYAAGAWGAAEAGLELAGEERRPVPAGLLARAPHVRGRIGIDREPVDATTEAGALLLRSFVWADQTARLELLDRAISELRQGAPELVRGDFVELLPGLLERRRDDALTVVFQTAASGYLPEARLVALRSALEAAGREGPLAYVSTGRPGTGDHFGLVLRIWPGAKREVVAHGDYHGAWLEWL